MAAATGADRGADRTRANEVLLPYVPRLVVDWLREAPTALHREVEGSMAFVDISGFTALSERLARRGRIGAELMRDTLDGVFTALLDDAYDHGAGLLKWGGDALLLLFDGPGHEHRAVRACWEMQQTLERVGRLRAGGSTIRLRMSIGVSTGTFRFFLTGSVHRELLIAGPAASETLTMEGIADAGEIALSPAIAARLDPACLGPAKDEAILLARPPEADARRSPPVGDVSGLDIPSCIPVASRAHVVLERPEPEHRTVTAAFIDLMDTDLLLAEVGVDRLAEALDERLRSIQEAALRYEVPFYESDVGKGSVKVLLTAGAPSSTGHDEERMLRALREIVDRPGLVPVRVGVNTGRVFTGDFGPPYRRSYRVFGDAINTAARVMSRAEAGQVLATEGVLERSRTTFETAPIAPFQAKGKAEPVRASLVGPITGTREARREEVPLIGRDDALGTILGVLDRARAGEGWIVELAAPAGVGKSALVDEVVARSPDLFVFRTRCEEYERSTPYFPMRAPMRTVLGLAADADTPEVEARLRAAVEAVDPALVPWVPLLGVLLGLDLPDTPETAALDYRFVRDRLGEVAMRFLYTRLAGTPTMLAVEDAQHMDDATRDLLLRLGRAGTALRQILLVTHDDAGTTWAPLDDEELRCCALTLLPLLPDAALRLVEHLTEDAPLAPHDAQEIVRRADGNTLFLRELIEALRSTGSTESLPDSVEAFVGGEIDRLTPADRTVLRYAAVLGAAFDPGLLAEAVRLEVELDGGVWSRLGALVEPGGDGRLRFRNPLVRDAAYEGLPFRRRRELHERVGLAIEAGAGSSVGEEVGTLALHFHEAQRWDKAWTYALAAASFAAEFYANVEAARFLTRAISAGRRLGVVSAAELAETYERLGDTRYRLGEFDRAAAAFARARALFGRRSAAAGRLAFKEAQIPARLGRYPQALRRVSRALRDLDGVRGREAAAHRARLQTWYGAIRYRQGRAAEAVDWCVTAEREARQGRAQEALAHAYQIHDLALLACGRPHEAVHGPLALAVYEELGDLWQQGATLNNLGLAAQERNEWTEARGLYDRAREAWTTTGDTWAASFATYNVGEILVDQGRHEEAEPLLREALRTWRASGADAEVADAERELGKLAARRGEHDDALRLLDAARRAHDALGQPAEVVATDARIAEALVLRGEPDAALEAAFDALGRAAALEGTAGVVARLHRVAGCALVELDDLEAGADELARAAEHAREAEALLEEALALELLGRVRRHDGRRALDVEERAAALLDRLGVVAVPLPRRLQEAGSAALRLD